LCTKVIKYTCKLLIQNLKIPFTPTCRVQTLPATAVDMRIIVEEGPANAKFKGHTWRIFPSGTVKPLLMVQKSGIHQLRLVGKSPLFKVFFYIPGGGGFQPSTVGLLAWHLSFLQTVTPYSPYILVPLN